MDESVSPLCCCEYFDISNERNHILACCCNCVDLDEGFESLIQGQGFPASRRSNLMSTLHDRLRIPWRGGARQVAFDAVLPILLLLPMLMLASISLWWTVFSFTAVSVIVLFLFRFFIITLPRTKFFIVWTITSVSALYVIFEFVVIPFLQILLVENIIVSLFIALALMCLYLVKNRGNSLTKLREEEAESGAVGPFYNRCSICQTLVPEKDHHCLWIDCCIGRHNQFYFILTLLFAILALIYSSNLTLTSVCHPFVFYKHILLPDDCSDVYQQFELGLAFVSAIYSLGFVMVLLIIFIHHCLLVSVGLTSREWRNLSLSEKCLFGVCSRKPHNRGFVNNWRRIICWDSTYESISHQMQ